MVEVEGHVEADLEERQAAARVAGARGVAVLAVGRDERDDGDDACLVEQRRHLRRTAHALAPVLVRVRVRVRVGLGLGLGLGLG